MRIRRHWVIGMILVLCSSISNGAAVRSRGHATEEELIVHYVNLYRMKHHLAPLKINAAITQEAYKHSNNMASKRLGFGHSGFSGRVKRLYQKIPFCTGAAENVAFWRVGAKQLVDGWIASPGHRRNIEGNYNLTGVGIVHSRKGWAYFTQIFVRKGDKKIVSRHRMW